MSSEDERHEAARWYYSVLGRSGDVTHKTSSIGLISGPIGTVTKSG